VGAYGMLHRDEHRNAPHHNMRVPDLAVTCADVDARQIALPEALLIVEILSPTDASDTWENVLTYVSIPSGSGTAGAPVCLNRRRPATAACGWYVAGGADTGWA